MADDWVDCPECQARVKAANLAGHQARAHGRGAHAPGQPRPGLRKALLVAGAVLLVVLAALALLRFGERADPGLRDTGDPAWGDPQAPVTAFLFADYQCPFCARFETEGGLDDLLAAWVEPGHVRLVYKDLAFISADSVVAAEASQVVWAMDPDAWPDWNRHVFRNQGPEGSGWADRDGIVALTSAWGGVTMQEFTRRLDAHEFRADVEQDIAEAREAGVSSTPTLVVGSHRVNANDHAAVEAALREATGR